MDHKMEPQHTQGQTPEQVLISSSQTISHRSKSFCCSLPWIGVPGLGPDREPVCKHREAGQACTSIQVDCQSHNALRGPPHGNLLPTPSPPLHLLSISQSRHLELEDAVPWESPVCQTVGKGHWIPSLLGGGACLFLFFCTYLHKLCIIFVSEKVMLTSALWEITETQT